MKKITFRKVALSLSSLSKYLTLGALITGLSALAFAVIADIKIDNDFKKKDCTGRGE